MKKLLLVAVAIATTVFAVARRSDHAPASDLAFDRIWIDHMPRGERDPVQVFVAVDDHAIGEFFAGTRWQGRFDAFKYESNGDELRVVFPQTNTRERLTIKASACEARGFDYCLEIAGSEHGAKRYYSRKDWVIDRSADIDARVQAIAAQ